MKIPTPNSPCKGCSNRYVGCQAKCSSYNDWKTDFEKKKAIYKEENTLKYGYHSTFYKSYLSKQSQDRIRKKYKQPGQY